MSAHSSPCPFFVSGMIENPNSFIRRKLALDEITARMTASQPTSINVVGLLTQLIHNHQPNPSDRPILKKLCDREVIFDDESQNYPFQILFIGL